MAPPLHPPPPPNLTHHVIKLHDQYLEGGGFGDVYMCQYNSSSGPLKVAVKALRFRFDADPGEDDNKKSVKMLRRELGIWRRLHHKNIVPFLGIAYGFGKHGVMSLVSLWMPNGTLESFLQKYDNQLGIAHRLQLLLDVANGLHYLHSFVVSPIIHGDLNSNNVLLDADFTARLTDFGFSSLAGEIPEALAYLRRSTRRAGALRWVAPEQIQVSDSETKKTTTSDVYSFGSITLQVLSGEQPWSDVHEDAAVIISLYRGRNPSRPGRRRIDDQHWEFIERCWSIVHERPTAENIMLSVEQFLAPHLPFSPLRDTLASSLTSSSTQAHSSFTSGHGQAAGPLDPSDSSDEEFYDANPSQPSPNESFPPKQLDIPIDLSESLATEKPSPLITLTRLLVADESASGEWENKEREQIRWEGALFDGILEDRQVPYSRRMSIMPPTYTQPLSLVDSKNVAGGTNVGIRTIGEGAGNGSSNGGDGAGISALPPVIPRRSSLHAPRVDISIDSLVSSSEVDPENANTQIIRGPRPLSEIIEEDREDDLNLDYGDDIVEDDYDPDASHPSSTESLALDVHISPCASPTSVPTTPNQPTIKTKRIHALRELLSSERAYASDLALIRDIHIPLALGQPTTPSTPFLTTSGLDSSSHMVWSASDSSVASSQLGPPMTRDDVRIIFGNIGDLALFSDHIVDRLEVALGGAPEGGGDEDRVGTLFLQIIPSLEPLYKKYITRHPIALAHLNGLPPSPALSAYLAHTRTFTLYLSRTHDLPSLLLRPVQRLLNYLPLLGSIIDATPSHHEDYVALVKAREKMEQVTRSVNEDRRRWEVVREVLGGAPIPISNGTGKSKMGVRAAASAHLRMKSLRGPKTKENGPDNAEAVEVARLEGELQKYAAFLDNLAKDVKEWRVATRHALVALWQWGITFGAVLGLAPTLSLSPNSARPADEADTERRSEAYDAFTLTLASLPGLCTDMEQELQKSFIPLLCDLKAMIEPPMKLLNAMHSLEPLHVALLHAPYSPSKNRRPAPALLTTSQSYLALRSALSSELPILLRAMNRATGLVARRLAEQQTTFYAAVAERWAELWDSLRVDEEREGGAEETLRVCSERRGEVEKVILALKVVRKEEWWAKGEQELRVEPRRERGGKNKVPKRSTVPLLSGGHQLSLIATSSNHKSSSSGDAFLSRSRTGSTSRMPRLRHPPSKESFWSDTSAKSAGKVSRGSQTDDEPPMPRLVPSFSRSSSDGRKNIPKTKGSNPARRRSSTSVDSLDFSALLPPNQVPSLQALAATRALYATRAIHPCITPEGVSYRGLPFFPLVYGDSFDVLREYGHPSTHSDLPLYVDDGEDCLLLVRARSKTGGYEEGDVGWALASFMVPVD